MKIEKMSDFLKTQYPHHHAAAVGCIKDILRQNDASPIEMVRSINEVLKALNVVQAEPYHEA